MTVKLATSSVGAVCMRVVFVPIFVALAPAALAAESPWNGAWTLDAARSSAHAKDMAAPGYAFTITPGGAIRWEIPALKEVVTGNTDGQPMVIHRPSARPGLTLSLQPEGPLTLHYKVARDGKPTGEGRMTLIEGGKAWVDISWQAGKQLYAGELVYVRP